MSDSAVKSEGSDTPSKSSLIKIWLPLAFSAVALVVSVGDTYINWRESHRADPNLQLVLQRSVTNFSCGVLQLDATNLSSSPISLAPPSFNVSTPNGGTYEGAAPGFVKLLQPNGRPAPGSKQVLPNYLEPGQTTIYELVMRAAGPGSSVSVDVSDYSGHRWTKSSLWEAVSATSALSYKPHIC